MSLEDTKILDETINKLSDQGFKFFNLVAELWIKTVHRRLEPPKALLKKVKKLAQEIAETCEELP